MRRSASSLVRPAGRRLATRSVWLAVAAVAATVALWLVLAGVTGLIFHFLPGATFLAATYVFRSLENGRRARLSEHAAILLVGAFGTATGVLAVSTLGRELDSPLVTLLVVATGAAAATVWLRRGHAAGPPPPSGASPGR